MATSRRTLLAATAAVPVAVAALCLDGLLRVAGQVLRPAASGRTATRCAACGAAGHTMLDSACPAAPHVRAGPQS